MELLGFCLLLLAILALVIGLSVRDNNACKARGGTKVHDGTFTYIWQVTDFKTGAGALVPHPNYVCKVLQ